jgi:Phage major capsid protein E
MSPTKSAVIPPRCAIASTVAKWSNPASTPLVDVEAAKESVRATSGKYPNVMLLSARALSALKTNPDVQKRFQYTSAASITTDMLKNYFGMDKIVVGAAVSSTDAGAFSDIWGTDVILAYVPQSLSTIQQPSFAYTYTMRGNPFVEPAYKDNNRKSWVYGVGFERVPVLTGMQSGFLIQGAA